ncbi:unnamed protein product [Polarella glacialis]|uniref:Uncharacterized protein n=1 Tax=Polarella glacialis TaxID=89957 RepID=A0A813I2F2_POLGL|nr:unnamed protein product [Polarella glacialis]CAE8645870.1 unnamed protein product [Polarella glacialis]
MEPKKAKALSAVRIARASLAKLGEQSEEQVRGVMAALEGVRDKRRARVVDFAGEAGELAQLDTDRKLRTEALLKVLVDKLTAAAHAVHGEAERLVEQRAGSLNSVLLENRSSMKLLESKLTVQTLEVSKVNKARWHKGLLLWRRQRHRHSMQLVMRRIRSNEFRQPESIVEACEQIQDQQTAVFQARKDLTDELFGVSHKKLTVAVVRQFEEQNTGLNDRAQEGFDSMLSDLKDLREALEVSAEQMLGELGLQLELIDAKSEWKGHESVTGLIDAEVRPPLRDQLDQVAQLLVEVADSLSRQEELQHYAVTKMIAWFLALAKKQEQLKKRVEEFEVNYHGEVEDCEKDFEDESQRNEDSMNRLHDEINDAAHHETLDELKQKTFDHLDLMAVGYRGHADQLLNIHNRYPPGAAMLIRRETRGYCQDLGLALQPQEEAEAFATDRAEELAAAEAEAVAALGEEASEEAKEAAVQQLREAAAAREPEILQAEAAAAEALQEAAGWPEGSSTGCSVLERMSLHELRLEVVAEHLMSTTTGGTPPEAVEATPAVAEGGEEGAEGDMVPEHKEPAFADGTLALQALHFDDEWLEPRFGTVQKGIFKNLTSYVAHLGRVDTPMCCEEVRRDLDQQLRKHTNRKGEVQVEWYVPRYGTVAKHKDKFERHLVDVAQKCQDQDDAVDAIFQELQDAEAQYCQRLVSLRERLGEAQTLPVLTSFDRQANDFAAGFKDSCKSGLQRLLDLGSRAVQALQRDNRAFLNMCRSGDEQYSESEIQFYGAEVEELNTTLEQRGQQRTQRARELEGKFEEKRKTPLAEFSTAYAEAVELLCASKGLGRKYGEPRRKAQERVRTLMARAETVRQNIEQLLEYVQQLCSVHVPEDGSLEVSSIPRSPALIRIKDYFKRSGDAWTLPGELMGTVYVVVCTMSVLGTHLGAFKGAKAPNYQLAALPTLRVLREDETLMPPAEEQQQVQQLAQKGEAALPEERAAVAAAVKTATSLEMEAALRENCLMNVMGPLMKSEHYTGEIASIVKASNEAYAGQAGGTPDFMLKFLSEMQTHSEHTRQEAARGLRAWGTELREQTLLGLGEVLYAELTARSLAELRQATKEVRQKSVVRWAECDSLRTSHEQQLNPGLSNPNAETKLLALVDAEAARHEMALAMCGNDRENMAGVCRDLSMAKSRDSHRRSHKTTTKQQANHDNL